MVLQEGFVSQQVIYWGHAQRGKHQLARHDENDSKMSMTSLDILLADDSGHANLSGFQGGATLALASRLRRSGLFP